MYITILTFYFVIHKYILHNYYVYIMYSRFVFTCLKIYYLNFLKIKVDIYNTEI